MAALLVSARAYAHFPGDEWALLELRQWRGGWLDDAAIALSVIGLGGVGLAGLSISWVTMAAVALQTGRHMWADALFLTVAVLAPAINLGLKELTARPRPDAALALVEESGYAFPSSHAVFAAAFFGALIHVLNSIGKPQRSSPRWDTVRWAAQGTLLLLIVAVGLSRVWLGVHWPSDVIGGFLFGTLYLAALVAVRKTVETRRQHNRI